MIFPRKCQAFLVLGLLLLANVSHVHAQTPTPPPTATPTLSQDDVVEIVENEVGLIALVLDLLDEQRLLVYLLGIVVTTVVGFRVMRYLVRLPAGADRKRGKKR